MSTRSKSADDGAERLHRADPERTGPIRNWQSYWRPGSGAVSAEPGAGPRSQTSRPDAPWSEVLASGVGLGYQVIEEQIRQGRRLAEEFTTAGASGDPPRSGYGAADFLGRLLRSYSDMGALWIELLQAAASDPRLLDSLMSPVRGATGPAPGGAPSNPATAGGSHGVSTEIVCAEPAAVEVDLRCHAVDDELVVLPLQAVDPEKPPLNDIVITPRAEGRPPRLRVVVPQGQPAGTYSGAVVDAGSNEARGTLTVRVST